MDIKYVKDNAGNNFFPLVHEKGVVDDNGTTLETKLQQKQDEITTVTVNVDNSTGIPSGSASMSGNTLSLNFSSIKGEKGDTGAQGIQGVQGERGPVGANGVTTDANIAIITGIDKTTAYDSTKDVASAEAVQDLVKMLGTVYYVATT